MTGLEMPQGSMDKLFAIARKDWLAEVDAVGQFFDGFGTRMRMRCGVSTSCCAGGSCQIAASEEKNRAAQAPDKKMPRGSSPSRACLLGHSRASVDTSLGVHGPARSLAAWLLLPFLAAGAGAAGSAGWPLLGLVQILLQLRRFGLAAASLALAAFSSFCFPARFF